MALYRMHFKVESLFFLVFFGMLHLFCLAGDRDDGAVGGGSFCSSGAMQASAVFPNGFGYRDLRTGLSNFMAGVSIGISGSIILFWIDDHVLLPYITFDPIADDNSSEFSGWVHHFAQAMARLSLENLPNYNPVKLSTLEEGQWRLIAYNRDGDIQIIGYANRGNHNGQSCYQVIFINDRTEQRRGLLTSYFLTDAQWIWFIRNRLVNRQLYDIAGHASGMELESEASCDCDAEPMSL